MRPEHLFVEENIDPTAQNADETPEPVARTRRPRLLWLIAALLAVVGVVVIGVAAFTSRSGPPQPPAAVAGTVDGSPASNSADPATSSPVTSSATPLSSASSSGVTPPSRTATVAPTSASATGAVASPSKKPVRPTKPVAPIAPPKLATRGPLLPSSPPVSLAVPAIGVTSPLIDLGLNSDNTVQVPDLNDPDSKAGWYQYSPTPGSLGPSIILGHIDSKKYGPGVFYNLGKLKPGDTVDVTRKDGKVAVFRIDGVRSYPKDKFPTEEVYGNLDHAGLRLITCGGVFDPDKGSYESNIVAFASLASVHAA